jgi:hypothetical protein
MGSLAYSGSGRYTLVIQARNRPKVNTTPPINRAALSADEYKAIGQGSGAQLGTWSVDETSKTVTHHIESAFVPNNDGTDAKFTISLNGDELKVVTAAGSTYMWKKTPPLQQVAAAPAQKTIKEQLPGTWILVSCDAKVPACVNPSGSTGFSPTGRYTTIVTSKDRPKLRPVGHEPEQKLLLKSTSR